MAMGNRLLGMIGKAARAVAKELAPRPEPRLIEVYGKIAGISQRNNDGSERQEIAAMCREGEALLLRREPDNPHDPNAIAVTRGTGEQLGYIARYDAESYAVLLDHGVRMEALVKNVTGGERGKENFGVNYLLRIWRPPGI